VAVGAHEAVRTPAHGRIERASGRVPRSMRDGAWMYYKLTRARDKRRSVFVPSTQLHANTAALIASNEAA
jgi:hypothetical protein